MRVLPVKEIENLLLVPRAIRQVIVRHSRRELEAGWEDDFNALYASLIDQERDTVVSRRIAGRMEFVGSKGSNINYGEVAASEVGHIARLWNDDGLRSKSVSGKAVLQGLGQSIKELFDVTITPTRIIDEMETSDLPYDFLSMLSDLEGHYLAT